MALFGKGIELLAAQGAIAPAPEQFSDIDELIRARTPEAAEIMRAGTSEALRQADVAAQQIEPIRRFGDLRAFQEQQALLGLAGQDAQQAAIGGIQQTPAQEEANRRQRETLMRQAMASGDVSGATLQRAGQLGAAQQLAAVQGRISELEPLAAIARRTRSDLSAQAEATRARRAQLLSGLGTQLANIRMGGAAPAVSAIQRGAELSGLRGIAAAQQRAQMQGQLAGLAGQFAPQITNFFSPATATTASGYTPRI